MEKYDLVIAGSGAAGLSAAIYAGRYKIKTLVVEGSEFGGQTSLAGVIENYPGAKDIDGYSLMKIMKEQAEKAGANFLSKNIISIKKRDRCFDIKTDDMTYHSHSVVIALGSTRRKLGVSGEKEFAGRGVHYCITCDGPLYSGKIIAIVGGGDAAVKGATLAAEYADKIYMIVRGKEFRAEPINKEKLADLGDKVEILYETEVVEINGKDKADSLVLSSKYNDSNTLAIDGLFVEIGADPNIKPVETLNLNLDEDGHIEVNNEMETSVSGAYAAGDITSFFEHFKQIVTAAAMGAVAATSAYGRCKEHAGLCSHNK